MRLLDSLERCDISMHGIKMEDVTFSRVLVCPFSENTHELDMSIQKPQVSKMLNSTDDPEQVCSLNSK